MNAEEMILNLKCDGRKVSFTLDGERGGVVVDQSLDVTFRGDIEEGREILSLYLIATPEDRAKSNFWFGAYTIGTPDEIEILVELFNEVGGASAAYECKRRK
jgi:hypothetical protein